MYNFLELKQETAKLSQRATSNTTYLAKIGTWLNLSQEFLYNIYDYFPELQAEYSFSSTADREDYPMPNDFDKPFRFYDIENDKAISPITRTKYFDGNITNIADSETGVPDTYMIYGISGITGVIAGDTLQVKSSSATDTAIVIRVEGWIDSAKTILDFENITVTGTSYVAGTTTFYGITHISKDSDSVGYITIADSSDVVIAYMTTIDRVLRHKVVKLGLIPDDAYDYRVLYKKKFRKMVNDYDYPFVECDNYLILDAWGWSLSESKESMDRATVVWGKAQEALKGILANVQGQLGPDYIHKMEVAFMQAHRV